MSLIQSKMLKVYVPGDGVETIEFSEIKKYISNSCNETCPIGLITLK